METLVTLPGLAGAHVAQHGSKLAVACNGVELSYEELERRASRVGNGLTEICGPGSRAAYLDRNRPEFVELLLGSAKAGVVLVPINSRLAAPEVAQILRDAGARALFVGPEHVALADAIRTELPELRHVLVFGEDYSAWRDVHPEALDTAAPEGSDTCLQMYTSGTTGLPKGVELTHAAVTRQIECSGVAWDAWHREDVLLVGLPLFHIAGNGALMIALERGMTIVLMEEFSPAGMLADIERHRVTVMVVVPAIIQALVSVPTTADLRSLRAIVYGAAPISPRVLADALAMFPTTRFHQIYGLTETAGPFTVLGPEEHLDPNDPRIASCGRPMLGMELRIVDGDGQPIATGGIGEVTCRTPMIMKGYWRQEEATGKAIRGDWFHTGDIGYVDAGGYLFLCDRKNDMIISGGENVYPAEIEAILSLHPDIEEVAVIGVPDERWGEVPKALVVARGSAQPDPEAILAFARAKLAGFKIPKTVEVRGPLPRNPTGKVLRRLLREPYWAGRERQIA